MGLNRKERRAEAAQGRRVGKAPQDLQSMFDAMQSMNGTYFSLEEIRQLGKELVGGDPDVKIAEEVEALGAYFVERGTIPPLALSAAAHFAAGVTARMSRDAGMTKDGMRKILQVSLFDDIEAYAEQAFDELI